MLNFNKLITHNIQENLGHETLARNWAMKSSLTDFAIATPMLLLFKMVKTRTLITRKRQTE